VFPEKCGIRQQRTSHHINRRTNTNSEEASTETRKEVGDHIIFESREFQNCLRQKKNSLYGQLKEGAMEQFIREKKTRGAQSTCLT